MASDDRDVDPRAESRTRVRSMPVRITQQPVVAEGDVEGSSDVWVLRMGGSEERCEAHALVGNVSGGTVVGTTLPVPQSGELFLCWAWQLSGPRFVLGVLCAPEVDTLRVDLDGEPPVVLAPVHTHDSPPARFFLADFYGRPVRTACSLDRSGLVLATQDISGVDTTGRDLMAQADAARRDIK